MIITTTATKYSINFELWTLEEHRTNATINVWQIENAYPTSLRGA